MADAKAPRKDQLRKHQQLIEAAREAFIEQGPDVALDEIAGRAGVGTSTLYRHFPDRDSLVIAVLDDLGRAARERSEGAIAIEDPEEAFRAMFAGSCQLDEREVITVLRLGSTSSRAREHLYRSLSVMLEPVTRRLQRADKLRPGVTVEDIVTMIRMADIAESPEQRAKIVEIILDGLIMARPRSTGTSKQTVPLGDRESSLITRRGRGRQR